MSIQTSISAIDTQRLASDPTASIYVSASAGTGKTKILCDRYLRLMLTGTNPTNILCVTFTNTAANEMEERIRTKLKSWKKMPLKVLTDELTYLIGKEPMPNELFLAQNLHHTFSDNIHRTKIQTIHSFCLNILQRFSGSTQASNKFKIIEHTKKNELFGISFDKIIANPAQDPIIEKSIKALAEFYDYHTIKNHVYKASSEYMKFKNFIEKFKNEDELYNAIYQKHDAISHISKQELLDTFFTHIPTSILTDCNILKNEGEELGQKLETALKEKDFTLYKQCFLTENKIKNRLIKKSFIEKHEAIYHNLRNEAERTQRFNQQLNSQISAELNFALCIIVKNVLSELEVSKKQIGLVEYDDLILNTLELLKDSEYANWILYNLDFVIDHILVDEAQDLNPIQWELIKILSLEFFSGDSAREINRTLFIVGDYKQSIYSFQGAEPSAFLQVKNYFASKVTQAQKIWRELTLNTSFRTTAPVLNLVDTIFNSDQIKFSLEDTIVKHIPYRNGEGYYDIWKISEKETAKPKNDIWQLPQMDKDIIDPKLKLAKAISTTIDSWLQNRRLLHGHKRKIEPQDIMILVRKRSDFTKILSSELKKLNISVSDQERQNAIDNLIILDLLAIAKFIYLPEDDLNLANLLKSPIIGITEQELFKIAHNRPKTLWEALQNFPKPYEYLNSLSSYAKSANLYELYHKILELDYKKLEFIARFGDQAIEVIDQFLDLIFKYKSTHTESLIGFIHWLETSGIELESPQLSSQNTIKITTVHGAKGLQAPIVILADAASSEQSPHENIFWQKTYDSHNATLDYFLYFSSYKEFDSQSLQQIKNQDKQTRSSENQRLLYVAMTRAEDELYIAGWENNKLDNSWYNLLLKNSPSIPSSPCELYVSGEISNKDIDYQLPSFLYKKVPPNTFSTTTTVTKRHESDNLATKKGKIIHEILQILPYRKGEKALEYIRSLKAKYSSELPDTILDEAIELTQTNIQKFSDIFTQKHSYAEIPLIGKINNQVISARIDLLNIKKSSADIIDFKTDTTNDKLEKYLEQLRNYALLVKPLYKDKIINCYILWVSKQHLEKVLEIY